MTRTVGIFRGLASLLALVALIMAVVVARTGWTGAMAGASGATGASGSPAAIGTATPSAAAASAAGILHFRGTDISFDYPAGWNPLPRTAMGPSWIAAFSTGPAPASCCAKYVIPAGTMDVSIAYGYGPINISSMTPTQGAVRMAAGNAPAVLTTTTSDPASGADLRLSWVIQRGSSKSFEVIALIKGPGTDVFQAQVRSLIASIQVS
jgi:hypothetical protein